MKYKKKKTQKKSSRILSDLIIGNRFTEIVKLLGNQKKCAPDEAYLYGYALLRLHKTLDTLVVWWPLALKKGGEIENDCTTIAYSFFEDERKLQRLTATDEQLLTLFYIARTHFDCSNAYRIVRQRLYDRLWSNHDYEKLEKVIKSSKDPFSSPTVENLSKLTYFQMQKKLPNNPLGFASYILTGGSCLLLRNPFYKDDKAQCSQLLSNHIKQHYANYKNTYNMKATCEPELFNAFVDYESDILVEVLQLINKSQTPTAMIVPTPHYLTIYDPDNQKVGTAFLTWLIDQDKALSTIYDPSVYHLTFWAVTGKRLLSANDDAYWLDSHHAQQYNPYLKLALTLRSISEGQLTSPKSTSILPDEFTASNSSSAFYRKMAIKTIENVLTSKVSSQYFTHIYDYILSIYPFFNDERIADLLIYTQLQKLYRDYESQLTLNFEPLATLATKINHTELQTTIECILQRSKQCDAFLRKLEKRNGSKTLLNQIQSLNELKTHMSLIVDCCYLYYGRLDETLFFHIEKITKNKKLNTLFPLSDTILCDFHCACTNCQHAVYRNEIPDLANKMNISTVRLPEKEHYKKQSDNQEKQQQKLSTLVDQMDNPFEVLDVSIHDDKKTIMKKVMHLMADAPQKMATLRNAQTLIFNPATRFVIEYFHFLAHDDLITTSDTQTSNQSAVELKNIPLRKSYYQL